MFGNYIKLNGSWIEGITQNCITIAHNSSSRLLFYIVLTRSHKIIAITLLMNKFDRFYFSRFQDSHSVLTRKLSSFLSWDRTFFRDDRKTSYLFCLFGIEAQFRAAKKSKAYRRDINADKLCGKHENHRLLIKILEFAIIRFFSLFTEYIVFVKWTDWNNKYILLTKEKN